MTEINDENAYDPVATPVFVSRIGARRVAPGRLHDAVISPGAEDRRDAGLQLRGRAARYGEHHRVAEPGDLDERPGSAGREDHESAYRGPAGARQGLDNACARHREGAIEVHPGSDRDRDRDPVRRAL